MLEITPFQDFFASLSQICTLDFEIRNEKGELFSSMPSGGERPDSHVVDHLAARIMDDESPVRLPCGDRLTLLGVPLKDAQKTVGSLIAYLPNDGDAVSSGTVPSGNRMPIKDLEGFLRHLAVLIEDKINAHKEVEDLTEELTQSFEDLHLFSRIATQIKTLKISGSLLKNLIADLLETMRADMSFAIMLERPELEMLICERNESPSIIPDKKAFVEGLINAIPRTEASLKDGYFILNQSDLIPGFQDLHPVTYRFLTVRVQHAKNNYGWLGLVSFNMKEIFRRSELRLLTSMAEQIGVVIANTDLYHDLERFVINVVKSLVHAIEAKDTYTRGHSERVSRYSMKMAECLRIDERQKNILHWAAILHDIGKIGIPEVILNKPDRLNEEEFLRIKSHPQKGCDILLPIDQLADSLPAILHHHERYDGHGYPAGLKGEEIPLLARVIAVADTFDAITSTRAYRSASSHEKAFAILNEVAGSQLDAELVKVFKEMFRRDPEALGGQASWMNG